MTASARLRIFVVDDNVCVADTVSLVLCEAGFQVTTFYNALLAVQHALQSKPDDLPGTRRWSQKQPMAT